MHYPNRQLQGEFAGQALPAWKRNSRDGPDRTVATTPISNLRQVRAWEPNFSELEPRWRMAATAGRILRVRPERANVASAAHAYVDAVVLRRNKTLLNPIQARTLFECNLDWCELWSGELGRRRHSHHRHRCARQQTLPAKIDETLRSPVITVQGGEVSER